MAELRTHRELVDQGETALVSALLPLPAGWTVLPHLVLPGHQFHHEPDDIDAVVLNERGIFLVEYRHWHGAIAMSDTGTWRHRFVSGDEHDRPNPLPQLLAKRQGIERFLTERGLARPPLYAVLAFPDRSELETPEGEASRTMLDGIPVMSLGQVIPWLLADSPDRPVGALSAADQASIAEQMRPHSPRRLINQYQLTSTLSRSESQTTYLAWDTQLERPMLLKELGYDPYQQPERLERIRNELLREARLTMQLRHEHIVNVEHVIPRDDCYYVVTEWLEASKTLAQVLQEQGNKPLPADQAVAITLALADALVYAHAQGIVHRDVRPENVLVAPKGVVKLANFGLAKKSDMSTRATIDLQRMTKENPYVAPESKLGQTGPHHVDQRADVYSLAAILYQLLTGRLPHHLDEKYFEPPSTLNPEVPSSLDAVVEKAMRIDLQQRFSTMTVFRDRLAGHERPASSEGARYTQRKLAKRTPSSLVFQAYDEKLQRSVALKKVLLEPRLTEAERQAQLSQLLREAQLASSLVHPHIVSVFDHFIEDGDGYIVMEWLEGQTLRELIQSDTRLSLPKVKQIMAQVGDALQYAHRQGVVHRDIKPENIIYDNGQATVLDFGIAHTTDRGQAADAGKAAGTARYVAPEVLTGQAVDVRSDVFSLGVVIYELLTLKYPYDASVILARYSSSVLAPLAAASSLALDVDAELDTVLARALEVDPEHRWPTIAEFQQAFMKNPNRGPSPVGPEGSGWPALVATSAVIFVLFLLIGLWTSQSYRSMFRTTPLPSISPLPSTEAALATPSPEPTPTPTPEPTPTPTPAPWTGTYQTIEGVTLGLAEVTSTGSSTRITLSVDNQSAEPVAFLTRSDRPELFACADDRGRDLTPTLDIKSVDAELLLINPGQRVRAGFTLGADVRRTSRGVFMTLMEDGGKGRKFSISSQGL